MEKIKIEICLGTTCFIMGSSKYQELEKKIPSKFREIVDVKAKTCLGYCQTNKYMKAPFVRINGELMQSANVEKIIQELERISK